jgi:LacI family transcriptional regulator
MSTTPITQQELASRLGVTQMTVSRALNGKGSMSAKTRERVLKLADQLGYRPNGMARRVHEGRYRGMALLGSSVRPSYNIIDQEMPMAVHAVLAAEGWHLTTTYMNAEDLADPERLRGLLDRLLADAVLVHDVGGHSPRVGEMLARHRVPAIWMNGAKPHDAVDFMDAEAAEAATAYLLSCGYRRPALVLRNDPEHVDDMQHHSLPTRAAGYRAACRAAGITPRVLFPPDTRAKRSRTVHAAYLRSVIAAADRPDALLCYGPHDAFLARTFASDCGLEVPRDLGLIAFGKDYDTIFDVALTTCVLNYTALGDAAARLALRKLEDPTVLLAPVRIPLELLVRDSTRRP